MFHSVPWSEVDPSSSLPIRRALSMLPLAAVPPIAVGISSDGVTAVLSTAMGVSWLLLVPFVLYESRMARRLLPVSAAVLGGACMGLLPLNSLSFVVDTWAAVFVLVTTIPKPPASRTSQGVGATSERLPAMKEAMRDRPMFVGTATHLIEPHSAANPVELRE
jgi:hypothetical protein